MSSSASSSLGARGAGSGASRDRNSSSSSSCSSTAPPNATAVPQMPSSNSSSSAPSAPPDTTSFAGLGVVGPLCEAAAALGWKTPSRIQAESIPLALSGRDVIGLAETGSGKTGAFAIPILQALLDSPRRMFACVLAPTRELAFQISEQFEALGSAIGLKTAVVVGGVDMVTQAIALARKPHVVVGTPGRIVDHLENTKGFSLRSIQYLVLDEADRMLSLDFEEAINTILASIPRERTTFLFSATMTSKVAKLQRASLRDPVRVEVSSKYGTVSTLVQQYLFIPAKHKETYLAYVLHEFGGQSAMVFASTCAAAQRTSLMLANLGFSAVCLHGQMSQSKRLGALNKFKAGAKTILVATDVASRGLDIPSVDVVLNYDVPANGKDYVHRVGRTARAGRAGRALTFVTQYDVELYQRIEHLLGTKLEAFPASENAALLLSARVGEAGRLAAMEMRERGGRDDDDEEDAGAGGGGGGGGSSRGGGGRKRRGGEGGDDADNDDPEGANGGSRALSQSADVRKRVGQGVASRAKKQRGGS